MQNKFQTKAVLLSNSCIKGSYFKATFQMEQIPGNTQPGQFIHVQIPDMEHRILRRPFSIFNVSDSTLSIIYKVVGEGSSKLSTLCAGKELDIVGPLGRPFSPLKDNGIIIAGGYGCAATYLLAKTSVNKPMVLIGGRSQADILLKDEYEALGCQVHISTDDGSVGMQGRVTELLESLLQDNMKYSIAACGPIPMLKSLHKIMVARNIPGELSLDHAMCCGVGACFACVTKVKASNEDGWRYARICHEGPVFNADDVIMD